MKFGDWFKAGLATSCGIFIADTAIKVLDLTCKDYLDRKSAKETTETDPETKGSTEEES